MRSVRYHLRYLAIAVGLTGLAGCNFGLNASVDQPDNACVNVGEVGALLVARHANQPLSERRLDAIFATANDLLQIQHDDCRDVACPVDFVREGPIARFESVSSVLTQETQLDEVFDLCGDFKVVSAMIGVCGSQIPSDSTVVLGCASRGGSVVIIADAPEDVWAHEWGHVQGLSHRNDCARNLMHAFELETNAVDANERDAFLSPTPSTGPFRVIPPAKQAEAAMTLAPTHDETPRDWARRVMDRQYLAGLPPGACACDRVDDMAAALAGLLDEPDCSHVRRANAVRALGLIGATQACPRLIADLDGCSGNVSTARLPAVAECFLALGRLVTAEENDPALAFLMRASDPSTWTGRSLQLTAGETVVEPLEGVFARFAVMALALADDPRAADHLGDLHARLETGQIDAPLLASQVAEALEARNADAEPAAKVNRVYQR